jgi:hypothetical protein
MQIIIVRIIPYYKRWLRRTSLAPNTSTSLQIIIIVITDTNKNYIHAKLIEDNWMVLEMTGCRWMGMAFNIWVYFVQEIMQIIAFSVSKGYWNGYNVKQRKYVTGAGVTQYVASSYLEIEPSRGTQDLIWSKSLMTPWQQLTIDTCWATLVLWKYAESLRGKRFLLKK